MKRLSVFLFVILLTLSASALAKKSFTLSGKKYKPKSEKILRIKWQRGLKAGSPKKRYYPESGAPTVQDGIVFVGTHGKVFYALNQSDGKILWKFKNDEPIATTPTATSGKVIFSDLGGRVIALSTADGALLWQQGFNREILGKPLVLDGKVYLIKGERDILALSLADGHVVWTKTIKTFVRNFTMHGHADIVADGQKLYFGLADGQLYALNAANGSVLWSKNLTVPLKKFKDIDAKVVIEGNSLFIGGYTTGFYRLNKFNGAVLWRADVNTAGGAVVLKDRVVVSDTEGRLVGLDKASGRQLWFNELNDSIISQPVLFQDKIFVASYDQDGFVVDPQNGNELQRLGLKQGSLNTPVRDGGDIFVFTSEARLLNLVPK